ncbi:MAG: tRNA (cytidine(34)-2'-O)-methyltransferase [Rickettsiales bacterium]|nr:tRNA (cytidine(34)-2'-O)-methyltransferase [Rickettsiales bacterium]
MNIVLFEPDIAQNTGSLIRLSACMGVALHIIEPCGFPFDDKRMRRVAMDYYDLVPLTRHRSWQEFLDFRQSQAGRLLLLTTRASQAYTQVSYQPDDMLLLGRESQGVPDYVRDAVDLGITIPMQPNARSLNVALAASMVLGEALRQTRGTV